MQSWRKFPRCLANQRTQSFEAKGRSYGTREAGNVFESGGNAGPRAGAEKGRVRTFPRRPSESLPEEPAAVPAVPAQLPVFPAARGKALL